MNPRLVKFMVELQNPEKIEKKEKTINFIDGTTSGFLSRFKTEKVYIPIDKNFIK